MAIFNRYVCLGSKATQNPTSIPTAFHRREPQAQQIGKAHQIAADADEKIGPVKRAPGHATLVGIDVKNVGIFGCCEIEQTYIYRIIYQINNIYIYIIIIYIYNSNI